VERCFGTLQNRLVKALRKAQVTTLAQANRYLEDSFLPEWQEKFTVPAARWMRIAGWARCSWKVF